MEYVGHKVKLTLRDNEGKFEGFVHSAGNKKLSLEKVTICGSDKKLKGLQHFYSDEIEDIEVLESTNRNSSKSKQAEKESLHESRTGPSLRHSKCTPSHLSRLQTFNPNDVTLIHQLQDKNAKGSDHDSGTDATEDTQEQSTEDYTILNKISDLFYEAIAFIQKKHVIGLSLEGSIDRKGKLCWLQIGTQEHVFMFDVLKLEEDLFHEGMKDILQNGNIMKVMHDCRQPSDLLHHQYHVSLVNIFDTQVADVFVYRIRQHGNWPRYVQSLAQSLLTHLGLSPEQVHSLKVREDSRKLMLVYMQLLYPGIGEATLYLASPEASSHWLRTIPDKSIGHVLHANVVAQHKKDEDVWAMRPAPKTLLEAALKNVMHLIRLREVLLEKMMQEFVTGVDIYLSHVRDASRDDARKYKGMSHLLPQAFQDLQHFMSSSLSHQPSWKDNVKFAKDKNGFNENCKGISDPNVIFSRDSLWHTGAKPVAKEKTSSRTVEKTETQNTLARFAKKLAATLKESNSDQDELYKTLTGGKTANLESTSTAMSSRITKLGLETVPVDESDFIHSAPPGQELEADPSSNDEGELSGTKLMRSLMLSNGKSSSSGSDDLDGFKLKPAGAPVASPMKPKKKKNPPQVQNPPRSQRKSLDGDSVEVTSPEKVSDEVISLEAMLGRAVAPVTENLTSDPVPSFDHTKEDIHKMASLFSGEWDHSVSDRKVEFEMRDRSPYKPSGTVTYQSSSNSAYENSRHSKFSQGESSSVHHDRTQISPYSRGETSPSGLVSPVGVVTQCSVQLPPRGRGALGLFSSSSQGHSWTSPQSQLQRGSLSPASQDLSASGISLQNRLQRGSILSSRSQQDGQEPSNCTQQSSHRSNRSPVKTSNEHELVENRHPTDRMALMRQGLQYQNKALTDRTF